MAYQSTGYRRLCEWVHTSGGHVPETAVPGGVDSGEPIYIGRAEHDGAVIPGKIVPSHNVCYVAQDGQEHAHHTYQVLVSLDDSQFDWIPGADGKLPSGAVQGGVNGDGEPLYIGRTEHNETLTIGKVQCSHGVLYIPYGGAEIPFSEYEVLVCRAVNF
ncbi:uncharacterized protein LOC135399836 [Ornithodoros turicata]|uniref:uncharacterized protein LOC135399836 n=1 Tax=Ornithodoros turicata TaxID=34597 RepID=UPI00313946AB